MFRREIKFRSPLFNESLTSMMQLVIRSGYKCIKMYVCAHVCVHVYNDDRRQVDKWNSTLKCHETRAQSPRNQINQDDSLDFVRKANKINAPINRHYFVDCHLCVYIRFYIVSQISIRSIVFQSCIDSSHFASAISLSPPFSLLLAWVHHF